MKWKVWLSVTHLPQQVHSKEQGGNNVTTLCRSPMEKYPTMFKGRLDQTKHTKRQGSCTRDSSIRLTIWTVVDLQNMRGDVIQSAKECTMVSAAWQALSKEFSYSPAARSVQNETCADDSDDWLLSEISSEAESRSAQ